MAEFEQPKIILFSQHGMINNNEAMGTLAHSLALPHFHVVAPVLGYANTLFQIEPLIQAVEQSADQALKQYSDIPARIIATSLGGVIWVEVLSRHPEWWHRIQSLVLLGSPIGGADLARIVDPFGWGVGIAKHLGKNRRCLAENITAMIPTMVIAGNTTGGSDGTVTIESTKLKHAHFVCLDGVTHHQIQRHPVVVKVIQEFWSQPRIPLPASENSLISELIEHFRRIQGITDASERGLSHAKPVFTFRDGTTVRAWTNPVGVKHIFVANACGKCEYAGFVGWVHSAGLNQAIDRVSEFSHR
ncbi:MAG: alpha/beta hydrolase [Phormidesmis sp. CAN_BIN44]|nr:alpha/beta hydrolase [Phormidesmis sp. CAN_BIN44]